MKRALALCTMAVLAAGGFACSGMPGLPGTGGGGGGDSKMPPMDANSPYMYASDFSGCESGKWVTYKQTPGDMETTLKCVGVDGDNHWMQVGMKMAGMEYDHLLVVGADGKVSKAWFSSKGYEKWESVKVNETPTTTGGGGETMKECPACKKAFDAHKKPDVTESDETVKVGDKSVAGKKICVTMYNCEGAEAGKYCYVSSGDVANLHQQYNAMVKGWGKAAAGGLVLFDMGAMKLELVGFGGDAKPKHELPK